MQKIISLFQRNYDGDRQVRDEVTPGAEWVIAGEGVATRKWDGTCCRIKGGILYKRYDAKNGKAPPPGFEPAQEPDPVTGHWPGWLKVGEGPDDRYFREGLAHTEQFIGEKLQDGTYELIGPKVNGFKDDLPVKEHMLMGHGVVGVTDPPRTFKALKLFFSLAQMEGIVWHHPDGRMVKIKKKDFGYKW